MKKLIAILAAIAAILTMSSCGTFSTDADTVNHNINQAAESFEVNRKIIFYNGITDKIVGTAEGRCSIERDGEKIQAICKVGPGDKDFTRDEMGLSDNMTYFAIQTEPVAADVYRKRIIIKPQGTIPDVDVQVGK